MAKMVLIATQNLAIGLAHSMPEGAVDEDHLTVLGRRVIGGLDGESGGTSLLVLIGVLQAELEMLLAPEKASENA